jgi:hypothetical protein
MSVPNATLAADSTSIAGGGAVATANSPQGNLSGRAVTQDTSSTYQDQPCCTGPKIVTLTNMILGAFGFVVGFIPGVPIVVAGVGGGYLGGTGVEAVTSWYAKDRALRQQIDRFEALLKGFGIQVTLLGENGQDVQAIAEKMGELFQKQREDLAAFQQREGQADQGAAETAQTQLEAAVRVNQQMASVLWEVCGAVDKMNDLVAAKALLSEGAAITQTRLQEVVGELSRFEAGTVTQVIAVRTATAVLQDVQEKLLGSETSFRSHVGRIVEQAAVLQGTTRTLSEQVANLMKAEAAARQRSDEATARFEEAQAASARLSAQLRELQEKQQARIVQLEGKVRLLERALHIASNNDGDQLRAWLAAAQAQLQQA